MVGKALTMDKILTQHWSSSVKDQDLFSHQPDRIENRILFHSPEFLVEDLNLLTCGPYTLVVLLQCG
jgi:hypothetical protein